MKKLNILLATLLFSATSAYACPPADTRSEEPMLQHACMHHAEVDAATPVKDAATGLSDVINIDNGGMAVMTEEVTTGVEVAPQDTESTAVDYEVKAYGTKFSDPYLFISPGDSVTWVNMAAHTSTSQIVPEGAAQWNSPMGENVTVDFTVPGIYVYVCLPHASMGMIGAIAVGDVTIEQIDALISVNKGTNKRALKKLKKALKKRG